MKSVTKKGQRRATTVDTAVAGRIKMYRKARKLSQSELAGKLGVTFQQVQKYESGANRVGAGRLFELAKALGVSVQRFFPDDASAADHHIEVSPDEVSEISNFAISADGWRLYRAFLAISDPKKRKSIIALAEELKDAAD